MGRAREREEEGGGGRYGESHFQSAVFILSLQPTPVVTFSFILHFDFFFLSFFLPHILPLVPLCSPPSDRLYWTTTPPTHLMFCVLHKVSTNLMRILGVCVLTANVITHHALLNAAPPITRARMSLASKSLVIPS